MKRILFVLMLAPCLAWAQIIPPAKTGGGLLNTTSIARVYYVDAVNGNDSWSGHRPDMAWKTIGRVNAGAFGPGDVILLRSGQSWNDQLNIPNSGTPEMPITYSSFGTGNKPIIVGIEHSLYVVDRRWVTFDGIEFQGGRQHCIELNGASNITFRNCIVGFNTQTGSGIRVNNSRIQRSDSCIVADCIFDSNAPWVSNDHSASQKGPYSGVTLWAGSSNWDIRSNVFRGWYHSAVEIYSDTATMSSSRNYVHHNKMYRGNNTYARGFVITGKKENCATRNVIAYNYIEDMTVPNQICGDSNLVYYNIINGMRDTLARNEAIGLSLEVDFGGQGIVRHNRVLNNVVYGAQTYGIQISDFYANIDLVSDNEVANNIVYASGKYDLYFSSTNAKIGSCLIRNNLFYTPGKAKNIVYRDVTTTVADLNTKSDLGDVVQGNLGIDPQFASLGVDFSLQKNSPCINRGADVGLSVDYLGMPIIGLPDLGVYEYRGQ